MDAEYITVGTRGSFSLAVAACPHIPNPLLSFPCTVLSFPHPLPSFPPPPVILDGHSIILRPSRHSREGGNPAGCFHRIFIEEPPHRDESNRTGGPGTLTGCGVGDITPSMSGDIHPARSSEVRLVGIAGLPEITVGADLHPASIPSFPRRRESSGLPPSHIHRGASSPR